MLTSTGIFLCALAIACLGIKLPDYFPRCSLSDPHLDQCIEDGANIAIPKLVSGNKDFNFPPFAIFPVPDIISSPCETGIKFKLVNVTAGNLEDARSTLTTFDIPSKTCNMTFYLRRLRVTGIYELDGNINGLPVRGAGQADITFTDVYNDVFWTLGVQMKEGNRHLKALDLLQNYTIKGARYSFSGLSNGDPALGKQASEHINNNWRFLEKLISPGVMESFRKIVFHVGKTVHDYVPIDEVFVYDPL